jgi:hypothetical protein
VIVQSLFLLNQCFERAHGARTLRGKSIKFPWRTIVSYFSLYASSSEGVNSQTADSPVELNVTGCGHLGKKLEGAPRIAAAEAIGDI